MTIEEVINRYEDNLTKTDKEILKFIISNKKDATSLKITELAKKTFSSPSSLTRLAKRLNFSGFSELKYFLENTTDNKTYTALDSITKLKNDIEDTIKLILQIDMKPIITTMVKANNIFVYGTDWGEQVAAQLLVRNFLAITKKIIFIPSITELKWCTKHISKNDLLILISYSGEDNELKDVIRMVNLSKTPSISITPISHNYLSTKTNYNIYYQVTDLKLYNDNSLEFNYFSPLYVSIDMLFRFYLETAFKN
ncbi:hypothetical protein DS831_04000 [Bombilactobacillus bombi]|uniref:HTH rpiR-type domain-containing protein n=1 Tax=Bombilactobacillus bombi TaxID=1303590 RepID=A0A417ZHL7_9LACO|nr:MurR/RpiR family transcriptional regulator [Bombilactobacillus bombi]RHW51196.1 hypothetical protein DS831_04000 [Bombilactobacillus bombi]